ncbi:MAG: hypothetical protein LBU68_02970 [Rickettsiales bacterium]|jgi:hypothetical protein|nr:hypothetical protein [Rickettsiales bacterium]
MNNEKNIKKETVVKAPQQCPNKSQSMCKICRKETPIPSCEISMVQQVFIQQKTRCKGD